MSAPPAYTPEVPPAGLRVPCTSGTPIDSTVTGPPPFADLDGSPVFVASALLGGGRSVHPCKFARGHAMYSYGGSEKQHQGRFDILPVTAAMEWVSAADGKIPKGRRPVEGGFEESGQHLFHALTNIDGVWVPGKTAEHLRGANFGFGGGETVRKTGYSILCWR
ncbi:hypothetical protein JCM3775_002141 [Rhodotorula graminis]|uniref:Uncharacterized protein n=1 Tax=Rhodotorula graminis (strain WP1) TaxID=578459 RepID=A0A0P9GZP8_RHOGW|nr:uncharacterized protein RHOBADRAFT_46493 [Rhodotorula graminis WP1]KPV72904.1 hypothetical protein RHOBADRAFT_46493 [Rhodotorula graminis WP1]